MDPSPLPVSPKLWNRTMKSDGVTVLVLTIRRPGFPESGKSQRIEHYFSHFAQQWKERWETTLYPDACKARAAYQEQDRTFLPWQASLDYQVTLWQPPWLSLRLDIREQGLGPLPHTLCIGEVWNTKTGYPGSLRSFLPPKPRRWKTSLMNTLCAQAQQQLASGESLFHSNCLSELKNTFDPDRFYLTEEGIVIYYPMYILGPYSEGIPTFTIPNSEPVQSNKL